MDQVICSLRGDASWRFQRHGCPFGSLSFKAQIGAYFLYSLISDALARLRLILEPVFSTSFSSDSFVRATPYLDQSRAPSLIAAVSSGWSNSYSLPSLAFRAISLLGTPSLVAWANPAPSISSFVASDLFRRTA